MRHAAKVAPRVGAWIETLSCYISLISAKSHPVWVRGLKQEEYRKQNKGSCTSHPVWVRGLKQRDNERDNAQGVVAPRVGAWIETSPAAGANAPQCRTPCGCVD